MAEVNGTFIPQQLIDDVTALKATMPTPATTAPPAVALNSAAGAATTKFALADHTHQSRLQARRIQITPDVNGRYVYVFPLAYDAGIIPIVNVTAENNIANTYRNDATVEEGVTTNTQCTIVITKTNRTIIATILGGVINVIAPQTAAVWINIMSRAPS